MYNSERLAHSPHILVCDSLRQYKLTFDCASAPRGSGGAIPSAEGRYSTMGRATAASVGNMLLQSRIRSSSNPDIPAPHSSTEDNEVADILCFKVEPQQQQVWTNQRRKTRSRFITRQQRLLFCSFQIFVYRHTCTYNILKINSIL